VLNLSGNDFVQSTSRKAATIKLEVEKLLKASFIYPMALTDWVSNLVPVNKKQGTIRVCVDYRDINKACPKDNFPTPFVDQIIDDCAGSEIFSLMDGFSGYNQINIVPRRSTQDHFYLSLGHFRLPETTLRFKECRRNFSTCYVLCLS
jgi:hypothetical protein